MVQYYTLEQAAQLLRTTPDQLKEMAKKNEVRAFQDRGTLRFRSQEIDELARSRGLGSDPDLQLGEAKAAKPGAPADAGGATDDQAALARELSAHARIPFTTRPETSVRRNCRPWYGKVSRSWSTPSKCSIVACRS